MKKTAIFGCKYTTKFLVENLDLRIGSIITIDPPQGEKHQVADYCDLRKELDGRRDIYQARRYDLKDGEDIERINALGIDLAFVIGWQRLIPPEILRRLTIGAFGMHGSALNLPLGRGRSPLNWSIIEGRRFFHTNLFRYDAGADSGDILDTLGFAISEHDTAETLHYKNTLAMKHLIDRNIQGLLSGECVLKRQREAAPTYYPKRSPEDSLIDWSRDVFYIERFIRAVTRPFNGAFTFIGGEKVTLWRAQLFDTVDFGYAGREYGQIVELFPNGKFLVNCLGGTLLVSEYVYAGKMGKGLRMDNGVLTVRYFPLNRYGFHDLEQ